MSGEIKLKCWQRCPKTTLEKQKTSFIASGKLPDNFWVDLFERKCPEGLGAVSENLKNGGFLTAEDFLDPDQNTTQIQEANSGKKTLYSCSGGQQADESVGFKTPCAKRRQSVIGTPSLFSQVEGSQCSQNVDEDVTDTSDVFDTPASLLKASGHHFVGFNKLSSLNPVSPDDGPCTSSPQRYTNEKSMLLRTPTPDILAMMSSHRPSVKSLSYLLAEDLNDDTTEWSESMATPPLEWDNDANEVAKDAECDDSKEQAHSKPVARVLFSRGTTRDSVSDLSMTSLETLEDTDVTGIETCNPLFDLLYRLENTTKEEATLNQEQLELQSVTPKETSRFMHTLAQSTPKPSPAQLDSNPLLTTPLTRPKSSPVISKKRRGTGHDREIDVSLETLLTPSTERSLVRAAEELSNSNGHVDACDVMFGSPCQSFEQAMALEAEEVNQAEVPDLASPGDVISLQLSKETTGQSNVLVPSLYKGENAFPECREQPLEETSLRRPSSPWKAPGLRLSKTKRFSYPVLSRVYKDDDKRSLQLSLVNENALEVARTTKSASSTVDCHQQSKGGNVVSQVLQTSYDQDSEPDVIPAAVKELSASGDLMEKEISTSKRDDKGSSSVDGERYFMSNQEDRSLSLKARRKLSTEDVPQPKRPKMERQVEIPGWNPTEILQKTRASPANDGNHSAVSVLVKEETSNNRPGSAVLSTTENTSCVGFRTGSGNLITVSEESLEKARSILIAALEDDDGGASGCFPINSSSAKDKRAVEHVNLVDMDDLTQFPDECMSPSNTSHLTKTTVSTYKANLQAPLEGTVGHSGEPSKIHYSARGGGMVHGQGAPSADFSEKRTEHLRPISRRECWTERSGQEEHYFTSSFQDGLTQVEVSPTLAVNFVGFHTAAGKTVQISEKSLKKARGLLQDIEADLDNRNVVGSEKQQSRTISAKVTDANPDENTANDGRCEQAITRCVHVASVNDESCSSNGGYSREDGVPDVCGFQTANGRKIELSEEALKKATATMKEMGVSLGLDNSGDSELSKQVGAEVSRTTATKWKSDSPGVPEGRRHSGIPFQGFQTASGKTVRVSEKALQKARKTISEIDREIMHLQPTTTETFVKMRRKESKETEEAVENLTIKPENGDNKLRRGGANRSVVTECRPGGERKEEIPTETLEKANFIVDATGRNSDGYKRTKGFHGTPGTDADTAGVVEDVEALTERIQPMEGVVNQVVKATEKEGGDYDIKGFSVVQTTRSTEIDTLEEALMAMDGIEQELCCGTQDVSKYGNTGLAQSETSSWREVGVSEGNKGRMTMGKNEVQDATRRKYFQGDDVGSGDKIEISKDMKAISAIHQNIRDVQGVSGKTNHQGGCAGFVGFYTASGNQVNISEEAFKKANVTMHEIYQDLQSVRHDESTREDNSLCAGFQAVSGKKVDISEMALKEAKTALSEIDLHLQNEQKMEKASKTMDRIDEEFQSGVQNVEDRGTGFTGFQAANGKKVGVSEEALKKARITIDQIDQDLRSGVQKAGNKGDSSFAGFQTTSGKEVSVSEEALKKARMTMDQIDQNLHSGIQKAGNKGELHGFAGFQTASGKKVNVSDEALKKARITMDRIDQDLRSGVQKVGNKGDSGFAGFQTASGKKVSVSEVALKKARMTMDQIDQDLQSGVQKAGNKGESSFAGFQTASGKKISVSEESLQKARMTMDQIDQDLHSGLRKNGSKGELGFTGFQTASGKKVSISEEALKKARTTMDQIDQDLRGCRDNDGNAVTVVCQTEGEQKTDSSFKKSNSKVQEVEVNFSEDTPPRKQFTTYQQKNSKVTSENYGAFQTGSGRTVQVSEKALEKARATLDEIDRSLGEVNTSTDNIRFECKSSRLDNCESETAGDVTLQVTPTPSMALSISDDVVSREILESSKALLADESFQEFLSTNNCITSTPCSAAKTPQAERTSRSEVHLQALPTVRTPHARNILQRNSTPFISHDDTSRGQVKQRSDMKAMKSTPSGVLYDRRSSRLSLPLTPQTINSDTNAGRPSARTGIITGSRVSNGFSRMHRSSRHVSAGPSPRAISPIQTSTSRSPDIPRNAVPLPRRGVTPFSSTAGRNVGIPRPHFSTPYRNSERGNRMNGEVSSESVSPSAKKPRLSGPPGLMSSEHGGTSNHKLKGSSKVKPQLGFLFKLRQHQGRTSLRQYVGNTKPARYSKEELYNLGVNKEVVAVTCSNAASFRFDGAKYFSDDVRSTNQGTRTEDGGLLRLAADGWLGLNEIQSAFLSTPGVERGLISDEWIENHYRWIVWKLAAMEVSFPSHFAGRCLTPHWILCQLKYRYDREVDHSHRSSLKKILERDDVSTRTMVLCVSGVCVTEDTKEESVSSDGQTASKQEELAGEKPAVIQVTDGWYDTRALLDKPLTRLLTQGRIQVGQKLCVYGADLVGSDQAVSPLEAPSSLMLRFHANSTRRARWDARLGLQRHAHAFPLKLASLFPDGGLIGCIDVIVLRQYPLQWMEKMPDGSNVFRSPRVEEREAQRFDRERQRRREALFMRVEREFEKESSQPELDKKRKRKGGQRSFNASQMETLRDGRDIHDALSMASDPDAFMSALDDEQRKLLDCYTCSFHESRRMELQAKFEQAWSEQEEHQTERNVVALLKVRVADYCKDSEEPKIAVLSVWRPSKEVMSLLSEGARLKIYHATASASRHRQGTEIQLSGTRTTRYQTLPVDPGVKCRVYSERKTTSFGILTQKLLSPYTEVDLVGVVVFCSPQTHSSVQTVYLADEEQNLVTIKFWGGLKAHALEGLVKPRCLVASSNLLVRPDDHVTYACLTFGDLSCLTLKPRDSHLRRALETLQSSIKSMDVFMAEIQEKLNSVLPKGFPFGTKQTGSRSHAVSPETPKLDQEDSPASKTLNSSRDTAKLTASGSLSRGMKSRQCKRKLLEGIPEPPPLSPLTCTVSAGARKEFKRPKRESDVHKHEEDLE